MNDSAQNPSPAKRVISVLFVCTANVCRSPTAHGIFLDYISRTGWSSNFRVDSAGTNARDGGKPPEDRASKLARDAGYDLSSLRARAILDADFASFDYIIAMDDGHIEKLQARAPADFKGRIALLMEFSDKPEMRQVPDPYYGSMNDFRIALRLIEDGCIGLLEKLCDEIEGHG